MALTTTTSARAHSAFMVGTPQSIRGRGHGLTGVGVGQGPEVRPGMASTASQPLSFQSPLSKKHEGGSGPRLSRLTEAFIPGGERAVHTTVFQM